jgi:putative spermidine/putrescine transport system ATP-binding protein
VADFVGVSNLISGEAARALIGREGTFTVRPEKIQLTSGSPNGRSAVGTIKEVEYLGPATRYLVQLDLGINLVALKQNTAENSSDIEALRNSRITLNWDPINEFELRN